ncbi:MAG: VOC family protein [Pseudomonadota bacterium]
MLHLDHLVIKAETLAEGTEWAEARLGVPLEPGGEHQRFGTHNRLLRLEELYLEVIAIDPNVPGPEGARWYGLDAFEGPPALGQWALASNDLEADIKHLGAGFGAPLALARGDLRWSMAVPETGMLPFDNLAPAVMQWHCEPAQFGLPASQFTLKSLIVSHPKAVEMQTLLAPLLSDDRVQFVQGSAGLNVELEGPNGPVTL